MLLAMAVFLGFLMVGCTKYATQEQLNLLKNTKEAALAAENMLQQKISEKEQWEKKVAQKEAELEAKKAERDKIKDAYGKHTIMEGE